MRYVDPTGHYTEEELNEYLGEGWEEEYFSENGTYGKRDKFVNDFLKSKDTKDLGKLKIIAETLKAGSAMAKTNEHWRSAIKGADALVARKGMSGSITVEGGGGGMLAIDYVTNLQSGEFSEVVVSNFQVQVGLSAGIAYGSISYGFVNRLPDNASYAGYSWGPGTFAGAGPFGGRTYGIDIIPFNTPYSAGASWGEPVGLEFGLNVGIGMTFGVEMTRYTESGFVATPLAEYSIQRQPYWEYMNDYGGPIAVR